MGKPKIREKYGGSAYGHRYVKIRNASMKLAVTAMQTDIPWRPPVGSFGYPVFGEVTV